MTSRTVGKIGLGMARVAAVLALLLGLPILLIGLLDHPVSWQNLLVAGICAGGVGALLDRGWGRMLSGLCLLATALLVAVSSAGREGVAVNKERGFAWLFVLLGAPLLGDRRLGGVDPLR